jgi:hypothetical protein
VVTSDRSQVIVVRAWHDAGRTIIRVLSGVGDCDNNHWVFTDVESACEQIAALIVALREQDSGQGHTKR